MYNTFHDLGFKGSIRYIGSQLRSVEAFRAIRNNIPNFSLLLSVECFSKRHELMREEKASLSMKDIKQLLSLSIEYGFITSYLYILGLEPLSEFKEGLNFLKDSVNRFPIFQILQNYTVEQEIYRVHEAKNIRFYLEARKQIEFCFHNKNLYPHSWENYRSLFYFSYNNQPHNGIRI